MKSKTKNKAGKKVQSSKIKSGYPAYYLAVVLAAVLLLEGFLLGAATPQAWQESVRVLDISDGFNVMLSDVSTVVEPMMDQVSYVTSFYQMAATETIALLDTGDQDPFIAIKGVAEFYRLASIEMEDMLDISGQVQMMPQVAGAFITR